MPGDKSSKFYGVNTPFYSYFDNADKPIARQAWLHEILRAVIENQIDENFRHRICVLDEQIASEINVKCGEHQELVVVDIVDLLKEKLPAIPINDTTTNDPSLYVAIVRRVQDHAMGFVANEKFYVVLADAISGDVTIYDPVAPKPDRQEQQERNESILQHAKLVHKDDIRARGTLIRDMKSTISTDPVDPQLEQLVSELSDSLPAAYRIQVLPSQMNLSALQAKQTQHVKSASFYAVCLAADMLRHYSKVTFMNGIQHALLSQVALRDPTTAAARFALMSVKNRSTKVTATHHKMFADQQLWKKLFRECKIDHLEAKVILDYLGCNGMFGNNKRLAEYDDYCRDNGLETHEDIQEHVYRLLRFREDAEQYKSFVAYAIKHVFKNMAIKSEDYFDYLFEIYNLEPSTVDRLTAYLKHKKMMYPENYSGKLPDTIQYVPDFNTSTLATRSVTVTNNNDNNDNMEFTDIYIGDMGVDELFVSQDNAVRVQVGLQKILIDILEDEDKAKLDDLIGKANTAIFEGEQMIVDFEIHDGLVYAGKFLAKNSDFESTHKCESSLIISILSEHKKQLTANGFDQMIYLRQLESHIIDDVESDDELIDASDDDIKIDFVSVILRKIKHTHGLVIVPLISKQGVCLLAIDTKAKQIVFYDPRGVTPDEFEQSNDNIHSRIKELLTRLDSKFKGKSKANMFDDSDDECSDEEQSFDFMVYQGEKASSDFVAKAENAGSKAVHRVRPLMKLVLQDNAGHSAQASDSFIVRTQSSQSHTKALLRMLASSDDNTLRTATMITTTTRPEHGFRSSLQSSDDSIGNDDSKVNEDELYKNPNESVLVCHIALQLMDHYQTGRSLHDFQSPQITNNLASVRMHLIILQNETIQRQLHKSHIAGAVKSAPNIQALPLYLRASDELVEAFVNEHKISNFTKTLLLIAYRAMNDSNRQHGVGYNSLHEEELYSVFGFNVQNDIEKNRSIYALLSKPDGMKQKEFVLNNYFQAKLEILFPDKVELKLVIKYFKLKGLYETHGKVFVQDKMCRRMSIVSHDGLVMWILDSTESHSPRMKRHIKNMILDEIEIELVLAFKQHNCKVLERLSDKNALTADKKLILETYLRGRGFLDDTFNVTFTSDEVTAYLKVTTVNSLIKNVWEILNSENRSDINTLLFQMNKVIFRSLKETNKARATEKILNPTAWTLGNPTGNTKAYLDTYQSVAARQESAAKSYIDPRERSNSESSSGSGSDRDPCVQSAVNPLHEMGGEMAVSASSSSSAEAENALTVTTTPNINSLTASVELPVVDLLRAAAVVLEKDVCEQSAKTTLAKHLSTNPFATSFLK